MKKVFKKYYQPIVSISIYIAIIFFFSGTGAAQTPSGAGGQDQGVRLKNLARINGVRSNQLLGYGLVVGLSGSGDTRSKLASESIRNLLGQLGQNVAADPNAKNIAAVFVTAEIPAFAKKGARLDVIVSSIGDARSLEAGVLIQTPLRAGNGQIFAVAQGVVTTGGRSGGRGRVSRGKTVGLVLNGAHVERDTETDVARNRKVRINLNVFDFSTLYEIKKKIESVYPGITVRNSGGSLVVAIPGGKDPFEFIANLEEIRVVPKYPARVIINERTGTVVMGGDIRIDPVSISRGGMQLIVRGRSRKDGSGISSELRIQYGGGAQKDSTRVRKVTRKFSGASISEIVESLNAMGAGVKDIIAILEALKESGALHAKLIVN